LEFPDVFYGEDGQSLPAAGFDAVLGNPPYISTHTSSEEDWRSVLERRAGYIEDLLV
jgi:methylase of polypeptide subunit release factors